LAYRGNPLDAAARAAGGVLMFVAGLIVGLFVGDGRAGKVFERGATVNDTHRN